MQEHFITKVNTIKLDFIKANIQNNKSITTGGNECESHVFH